MTRDTLIYRRGSVSRWTGRYLLLLLFCVDHLLRALKINLSHRVRMISAPLGGDYDPLSSLKRGQRAATLWFTQYTSANAICICVQIKNHLTWPRAVRTTATTNLVPDQSHANQWQWWLWSVDSRFIFRDSFSLHPIWLTAVCHDFLERRGRARLA